MDPRTYARLYGPRVPVRPRARPLVVVLAAVLWAVTLVPFAFLAFLVSLATLWGTAGGGSGLFFLCSSLVVVATAALLILLAHAPGVRDLAMDSRMLLLGAAAGPLLTVLAGGVWVLAG
ncbi:hypothetical protein ACLMNJ_06685 [Streptomyces seoulensis]